MTSGTSGGRRGLKALTGHCFSGPLLRAPPRGCFYVRGVVITTRPEPCRPLSALGWSPRLVVVGAFRRDALGALDFLLTDLSPLFRRAQLLGSSEALGPMTDTTAVLMFAMELVLVAGATPLPRVHIVAERGLELGVGHEG